MLAHLWFLTLLESILPTVQLLCLVFSVDLSYALQHFIGGGGAVNTAPVTSVETSSSISGTHVWETGRGVDGALAGPQCPEL